MTSKTLNDGFHEYLDNIKVTQKVKETLEDVRMKVRHALTEGIGAETEKEGQRIRPRFMTQGSARYKTQNMPCNPPKRQIDYDYGCYLPLSYHEDDGSCKPQKAAKEFFVMVGVILSNLAAQQKGWKYEEHKKCCRLVVSEDIHFDVPLYSVPDKELKTIRDSRALEHVASFSQFDSTDQEAKDLEWDDLPTDSIMLAENDGKKNYSWRVSDPRLLNVYFEGKSDDDRDIYRILKGWRDYNWQNGDGPSSIFLMSLAEKACNKTGFSSDIESELKKALGFIETCPLKNEDNGLVSVENPVDPNDTIKCQKQEFQKLQQFARGFRLAITNGCWASLTDVCVMMQSHLGDQFPILSDVSTPNFREPPRTTRAG